MNLSKEIIGLDPLQRIEVLQNFCVTQVKVTGFLYGDQCQIIPHKKIWIEVCLLQLYFCTVENPVIDCINYSTSTFIKKKRSLLANVSIRSQLQILISMSL